MGGTARKSVGGGIWKELRLLDGEEIADEQSARYRKRDFHRALGKLIVTNKRLIFCPAKFAIPWRDDVLVFQFDEISAIGKTKRNPWFQRMFLWGMGADSWFIDSTSRRHWFDVGQGWNDRWLPKLAERVGLPVTHET